MSNKTVSIINKFAKGFEKVRRKLLPENSRLFLLKIESEGYFVVVSEITVGWMMEPNEYRGQMTLFIATNEIGFENAFAQTTFVGYGVADADGDIDVFSIEPDRRDVFPPSAISPLWKVYLTREAGQRFTVPA